MSRFMVNPSLDEEIAERVARPAVAAALDMLSDAAQTHAPDCKEWISARDERVRPTHVQTDSQLVPANLRYLVPKVGMSGQHDLARVPRDPDLPIANRANCRCESIAQPTPLRSSIHSTGVQVQGARAFGSVETRFPRAAESEFGTDRDEAAHFMTNALREVAARLQSGQRR